MSEAPKNNVSGATDCSMSPDTDALVAEWLTDRDTYENHGDAGDGLDKHLHKSCT